MKRILNNLWLQLLLGFIAGILGVVITFPLAILFYIKFAGFELFFDTGSSGDGSPITFLIAAVFFILTLAFPTLVWFFLNRVGNLKSASNNVRTTSFILFATLPLLLYFGREAFSKVQSAKYTADENYHAVRDPCVIKDGVNKEIVVKTRNEFECKAGVLNGFTKTYNAQGILIYEATYLNGKLNGTETAYYDNEKVRSIINYKDGNREGIYTLYHEDGNTDLYVIYDQGKTRWVYHQSPEVYFEGPDLKTQKIYCERQGKPAFQNTSYTCLNNVINGEYIRYGPNGGVVFKENFVNGVLDGTYEKFIYQNSANGKLYAHLEFKNGKLDGTARGYSFEEGILEYEGHYTNGLQNGFFRRYNRQGNVESEVVFERGQLVKINTLPPFSETP